MAGSPYAAALGRFKSIASAFLTKEQFASLVNADDLTEVAKLLEPTLYGPELAAAAATYEGTARFEVAINRLFVRRNREVLEAAPFAGKPLVTAYLRRWDVENLAALLSAKAQGRSVAETESFLVSDRSIPAGLLAGTLTLDDYRLLLQQPTIEAIASQLVRFGYGAPLLPLLEAYERTHDVFPLVQALTIQYYATLLESDRFFQGDEWVVREYLQEEIDIRNVLLLLKGKDAGLPLETILPRFIPGGTLGAALLPDLYGARGVDELVQGLAGRFPSLMEGLAPYKADRSLVPFDLALTRERSLRELRRLRSYPMSISVLFSQMLQADLERADLRKIVYGKQYGIGAETLGPTLIVPGL
jgi:vacuolar-type H+-ATPase subunit C/Vma6